ncbi:uncharacterized protein LOC129258390 [Lytechinus pictus]|uniref:uncharacterized protein LOC129258390 n=1 Tax=Lytechinus pictus TaxID=7653 RepID=UPI00240E464E|nr:uncharacterized protein LOC129258390 [Lytechinus pictus]
MATESSDMQMMQQLVVDTPYQALEPKVSYRPRYRSTVAMITGTIQLLCGIIVFVLGIVCHAMNLTWSMAIIGVWAGLGFFSLSGVLGITSARRQTSVIVGYMTMSILSAVVALVAGCTYVYVVCAVKETCPLLEELHLDIEVPTDVINCSRQAADIAMNGTLAAIFFVELVFALIGSCITCSGIFCNRELLVATTLMTDDYE